MLSFTNLNKAVKSIKRDLNYSTKVLRNDYNTTRGIIVTSGNNNEQFEAGFSQGLKTALRHLQDN